MRDTEGFKKIKKILKTKRKKLGVTNYLPFAISVIAIIARAIVAIHPCAIPRLTPINGNSHITAINKKSHALIFSIILTSFHSLLSRYFIKASGVYIGFCGVIEGF